MSLPTPPSPMPGSALRQRTSPNRNNHQEKTRSAENARTLIVHNSITIRGAIENIERLIVEGTVAVEHLTVKELIVSPEGHFHGVAEAGSADIAGTLEGDLTVRNMLTVRASGRLLGNAECRRLQVDEGGQVTGKLGMITSSLPGNKDHNPAPHHDDEKQAHEPHHP